MFKLVKKALPALSRFLLLALSLCLVSFGHIFLQFGMLLIILFLASEVAADSKIIRLKSRGSKLDKFRDCTRLYLTVALLCICCSFPLQLLRQNFLAEELYLLGNQMVLRPFPEITVSSIMSSGQIDTDALEAIKRVYGRDSCQYRHFLSTSKSLNRQSGSGES